MPKRSNYHSWNTVIKPHILELRVLLRVPDEIKNAMLQLYQASVRAPPEQLAIYNLVAAKKKRKQ